MSTEKSAYRWWENYLVRYFMPSIAGAAIVNWLVASGHPDIEKLLLLELGSQGLQAPTLVLLILYGNLFCYISSYPILGFHVTRVVDFERENWRPTAWDGYVSTFVLASIVLLLSVISDGSSCVNRAFPFAAVLIFGGLQLYRIKLALVDVKLDGLSNPISKICAYSYAISKRRSAEQPRITKQWRKDQEGQDIDYKFDEGKEWRKRQVWRQEFIDTYRHMREHGNSAFIFFLELTLAGLCYLLLAAYRTESASFQLSLLGILLAIWAVPAVFIHFVGQHLERQFSCYDER